MQCESFSRDNKPTILCTGVLITGAKLWSLKTLSLSHAELQPGSIGLNSFTVLQMFLKPM